MKIRILSLISALIIIFSITPAALAADPDSMTDIADHWAKEHIIWAMEEGLFSGVSDTTFNPDGSMTRGMFVTVLGRLAEIDKTEYTDSDSTYADVDPGQYYAPYINWASEYGIAAGTGNGNFSPNANVSREQMAAFIVRFANIYNYDLLPITDEIIDSFADQSTISDYAIAPVEVMRTTGLLVGIKNSNGTYSFNPKANATRAQCAAVFRRLDQSLSPADEETIKATQVQLSQTSLTLRAGETAQLHAVALPEGATDSTIKWISTNSAVASVTNTGLVTYVGEGQAKICAYTSGGVSAYCLVTCESGYIARPSDSYTTKCNAIFGKYVDNPRAAYATAAEAEAHMVTIGVKVWDFADSSRTTKVTKTRYMQVHENIAPTVIKIFDEIYQCDAQYPINSVGGYGWRGANASEHSVGLAIDINPNENYYCYRSDGTAITGTHFDPENDPYSMPIDGEIQKIFEKYGFTRGIYWSSKIDYMHYSFFGT